MARLEEGESVMFNGFVTSPATARGALHHLMDPLNSGITVGRSAVPKQLMDWLNIGITVGRLLVP
jgi:hypothetical protein